MLQNASFDQALAARVRFWAKDGDFGGYLFAHEKKIAKKLRQAHLADDQRDVAAELFVARAFVKTGCRVAPEPDRKGGPDLLVRAGEHNFYCEVARIKETEDNARLGAMLQTLKQRVEPLPDDVTVHLELYDLTAEQLTTIEEGLDLIVQRVRGTVHHAAPTHEAHIPLDGLPEAAYELTVKPLPQGSPGHFECPVFPIFYSQQEFRKFGDILCTKLRQQIKVGRVNVLYVRCSSSSHDWVDFERALRKLSALDENFFAQKGYRGRDEFLERLKALSAIVVDTGWVPVGGESSARLWKNPGAGAAVVEEIERVLREAAKVRW